MISNTNNADTMGKLRRHEPLCPKDVKQMPTTGTRRDGKNKRESSDFNSNNLIPSILYHFNGVQKYKASESVLIGSREEKCRARKIKLKPT